MKKLLFLVVIVGIGIGVYYKWTANSKPAGPSVYIGASVEEVEQVLAPPLTVLPNFGNELRTYKAKSGKKYTLIFSEEKKVLEIHE
jgi:hypothetical protein